VVGKLEDELRQCAFGLAGGDTRVKLQIDPPRLLPETRSAAAVSEALGDAPTLLVGEREHRLYVLKPEKIEYIEADGNYVKLHADTTEYISRDTMKRLSNVLSGGFIRIERSLLINIRAVAYAQRVGRRTYAFTLVSGSCLYSSAKYRDEILRALPLTQKPSTRSPGIGNSSKDSGRRACVSRSDSGRCVREIAQSEEQQ
jgi:two-component system LytT family response regulator